MSVKVILDRPFGHFTNLDFITGRAVLTLAVDTPVSSIAVKLEGESRTRLVGQRYPHSERSDKKRSEVEVHKVQDASVLLRYRPIGPPNWCIRKPLTLFVTMGIAPLQGCYRLS